MENNNQNLAQKLYRSKENKIIWGVCGGLGEYFNIDPIIFRVIFLALTLGAGSGVLLYIVLALVLPLNPNQAGTSQNKFDFGERAESLAAELKNSGSTDSKRNWLGGIIILVGFFALMNQVFPHSIFNWGIFWSFVIIAVGAYLILGKNRSLSTGGENKSKDEPMGQDDKDLSSDDEVKKNYKIQSKRRGDWIGPLFFGLVLIAVGFAFLASNLGMASGQINWMFIGRLWPVFIIIAGLSLFARSSVIGTIFSILALIIILPLILMAILMPTFMPEWDFMSQMHGDYPETTYNFDIPKEAGVIKSEVYINFGAAEIEIDGGSSSVIKGYLESDTGNLFTESIRLGSIQKVSLLSSPRHGRGFMFNGTNRFTASLNSEMPIDLKIDSGASSLDLDLSRVMTENLYVNSGASKMDVILGDKVKYMRVEIDSGASSLDLSVPKDSGVSVKVQGGLLSKEIRGFSEISDGNYETDNYLTAPNKIDVYFDGGVSKITVERR